MPTNYIPDARNKDDMCPWRIINDPLQTGADLISPNVHWGLGDVAVDDLRMLAIDEGAELLQSARALCSET